MRAEVNTTLRCPTVQGCFCAAVAHADILQSLPASCPWASEHMHHGQALAFWRSAPIIWDP